MGTISTMARWIRNYHRPVMKVKHADLKRYSESDFKTICPMCEEGLLLVHRDQTTLELLRHDHCTGCAQQVYYIDSNINGEKFKEDSSHGR